MPIQRIETKRDDDKALIPTWSLWVNGSRVIWKESYQVVSNVAYALSNESYQEPDEAHEVARTLRRRSQ